MLDLYSNKKLKIFVKKKKKKKKKKFNIIYSEFLFFIIIK
jgi:hypothetical protein